MKKVIPMMLAMLLLTGCAAASPAGSYRQVTTGEAVDIMARESEYILLDVRTAQEFAQAHIPGAINIPNESIGSQPPAGLPERDQLILIYCRSGNRSKQAAEKLVKLGYTNIIEFGGINSWTGETVSGTP